ncbi:hypothetical protein TSOC_005248 [Tetrabaena socialis]|uniref:Uncharacterized protein n=1 Tax=Tetrabaena socialis TaxID=47790 RepID=A0A2J8A6T3_9CHLO|nr:hypothetical protein TSOC_005248 [Tetrabaena socialis]|eukprot:PNH08246.1 hypothetical protein TSOC_005248 [Tetrabaena socialis]
MPHAAIRARSTGRPSGRTLTVPRQEPAGTRGYKFEARLGSQRNASEAITPGDAVAVAVAVGAGASKRGVVIVQLWNGFDPSKGQPLYEPWVVQLLEAALATPGVRYTASLAPGGLGLSAVLWADREPWSAWGPHLASFGCQANTVAGSPYYKVLIGKILGYKDDNIYGYVRAVGGGLTPAVVAQSSGHNPAPADEFRVVAMPAEAMAPPGAR